jgi:hypothetical protein
LSRPQLTRVVVPIEEEEEEEEEEEPLIILLSYINFLFSFVEYQPHLTLLVM